jgi:Phage major capsid protein E
MPLHLEEFQGAEFQGYIDNVPAERSFLLETFMPAKNVFDIKFSYNVINRVYARTASITGFNASAPLRDKDGLARHFGEVAKVQHGFRVDEEELLRFNRPRSDEERAQAIEYVYDQTDNLVQGVRETKEWMRAQAIYKDNLVYEEDDVQINVTFGIPAENKIAAGTAWTDRATSTPLEDIQEAVAQFKKQNRGQSPAVMHLSSTVVADLLLNEQIKAQLFGSPTDKRLVTKDDLRTVFSALTLPTFVEQDDEIDNGNGLERLLPERRIVFLPSGEVGKTMSGVTVEKNYQPGTYVITEIQETNPPQQKVFVGETVFPALQRPTAIVYLNV